MLKAGRWIPAALSPASAFWCPSQSHGTFPCCEFRMCWDWGEDRGIKRKAYTSKGCYRLRGTPRNSGDLICVCTAVMSHALLWFPKMPAWHSPFCRCINSRADVLKLVVFLRKSNTATPALASLALFSFRRAACISLDKRPDPHITVRCSTFCFFLCLQEGWESLNKILKLTNRRSLVWSHCFIQAF